MTQEAMQDKLDQVHAVVTALFDLPVGVGVTDPRAPQPDPMGTEAAHLGKAIAKRQREFAAGRAAARRAMQEVTFPPVAIPAHPDRSPIWPDGIAGSISHKDMLCVAVVTREPACLGLDIEEDTPLKPGLLTTICSETERANIAGPQEAHLAKLIFCAKEAAYKAQYPITRQLFGFGHMEISLNLLEKSFTASFTKPVGIFAVGDVLPGRFDRIAGHLVTAVTARQGARKGA